MQIADDAGIFDGYALMFCGRREAFAIKIGILNKILICYNLVKRK